MTKRTRTQQDQWQAQRDERMSILLQQLEASVPAIESSDDFKLYDGGVSPGARGRRCELMGADQHVAFPVTRPL